jgi:N-acetylglutamate synthase-like GNAT family acetyltransferase
MAAMSACRRANDSDIPALVQLINRAYEVEAFFVNGDRTDAAEVGELLDAGDFFVLHAEPGAARPLGCVYVAARPDARAYLGLLSVEPEAQKLGSGRRLVDVAEEHARALGARFMELYVVDLRPELPTWYARLGYELTGEVPVPEHKTGRFTRPIRFLRMEKRL